MTEMVVMVKGNSSTTNVGGRHTTKQGEGGNKEQPWILSLRAKQLQLEKRSYRIQIIINNRLMFLVHKELLNIYLENRTCT